MKKHASTIILSIVFLIGLSLLLYPSFSNYWNSKHQSEVIAGYTEQVNTMDEDKYEEIWNAATEYNKELYQNSYDFVTSKELKERYNNLLDIGGTGIMGYLEIPAIKATLPVYHGTDEGVLQVGVGHLDMTSLPVGGAGTHCVLSGHRGLPSSTLFTHLDRLVVGDVFMLKVLDEVLTYEIDQILIVEPTDVKSLYIVDGQDLCTLVTCTPYGVNSHRLLVRGHRIETDEIKNVLVTADAIQIKPVIVAPIVATPILIALLIYLLIPKKKSERRFLL